MELREQIAATLADVKNWEEFKKQYRFSAATHLEIADRIVGLLAKEGYGKMADCEYCQGGDAHIRNCPKCHGAESIFEPIK